MEFEPKCCVWYSHLPTACYQPLICRTILSSFHPLCLSLLSLNEKKALGEMQTLHASCSKVELKNFAPPQTFPGARDDQNLIGWGWSLPLPTDPVW